MVSPAFLEAHPHFAAMDAKQELEEPEELVEPTVRPVGRGAAKAAALEAKAAVMSRRPVVTMLPPALAASGSPSSSVPAMSSAADSSAHLAALAAAAAASTSSLLPAAAPAAMEDALSQRLTRLEGCFLKIERFIEGKLAAPVAPVVSAQLDADSFDQSVQQPQPRLSVRPDARWRSSASGPPSASSDAAYIVESLSSVFEGALARMERMVFFFSFFMFALYAFWQFSMVVEESGKKLFRKLFRCLDCCASAGFFSTFFALGSFLTCLLFSAYD